MTTMKNNRIGKYFFSTFCILLALCTGFIGLLQLAAKAAEPVYYVEDIKIYAGEGKDKAKKYFEKNGYIAANIDLNADTDTGKDAWLGYKLTTNKDMAITDIRIMGMDTGYQLYDYDALIEYLMAENAGTAQTLLKLSQEFSAKYNAGSPKAKDAYEGLNLFYVNDENNTKLGDYILSGKADIQFFTQLIVKAGAGTVNAVLGFLNVGIAPFENEYDEATGVQITTPWADLVTKSTIWAKLEKGLTADEEKALHQQYNDIARELFKQIQDFTALYQNAAARMAENGGKVVNDLEMNNMEEAYDKMNEMDVENTDSIYISAFELLNTYPFNDEMNLGDWFISIGLQTSDQIDLKYLYPVIDAMGESQATAANIAGFMSAVNNLGENEHSEEFADKIPEAKEQINEYNNSDAIYVFENCDDEIENKTIGFTNEAIRKHQAEFSLGKMSKYEIVKNKINEIIGYVNLAMGALFVGVYVVSAIATAGIAITNLMAGTCIVMAALNTTFMAISTVCAVLNTVLFWAGPAVLGITIGLMIGFWIGEMLREKKKDLHHSDKPDFVFDAPETAEGVVDIKYKSVLDDDGDVADINRGKQWKWTLLAYTTDTRVGSPIRADKDGNVFKMVKDNPNFINGYDCARYYGERNAGDVNFFCEDSGQFYLHYRTEASIAAEDKTASDTEFYDNTDDNGEEKTEPSGNPADTSENETQQPETEVVNYISDIVVAVGKNADEAKAMITKKEDPYNIINYNLSPDRDFATYIGYLMTTNPDDAITDLRVAPYVGQTLSLNYGDIKYTFIEVLGVYTGVGVEKTKPSADAIFFTKDKNAGSPIPVDGLHPVKSFSEVKEGWEPVSFFGSDVAYNFNTRFKTGDTSRLYGRGFTSYDTTGDHNLNKKTSVYLYYEPSVKYTSGTKYLSGIFFLGGFDCGQSSDSRDHDEHLNYISEFVEKFDQDPRCKRMSDVNLIYSNTSEYTDAGIRNLQQYIYYTWTYNPKRAISDVSIFQGDTYTSFLPFTMSNQKDSSSVNYVAAVNFQQQYGSDLTDDNSHGHVYRFVHPYNAFIAPTGLTVCQWIVENVEEDWTTTKSDGFSYGYKKVHHLPTGLYISGYVKGLEPLTLDDVALKSIEVESYKADRTGNEALRLAKETQDDSLNAEYTVDGTKINYNLDGVTTLAGNKATDTNKPYRPVYEMKNPHSTRYFNLTYGDNWYTAWSSKKDTLDRGQNPLTLFIRGQQQTKQKYISSISVGSFSRQQYKQSNKKASEDELKEVDKTVNLQAMIGAVSGCSDEILCYNFAVSNQSDAWYNRQKKGWGDSSAPENKPAAYIGVTRTDKTDEAIKGVILYQLNDTTAPNEITLDGSVKYICAGVKSPIYINGKSYFLYYTRNKGAVPGKPIEEITIDTMPIVKGSATNLCGDQNNANTYGDASLPSFIHLKYTKTEGFFTKLYVGTGETKNAAMTDLLSQGCVEVLDYDVNTGIKGRSIVIGYRSGGLDQAVLDKQKNEAQYKAKFAKQTEEAIYDIIVTSGEPFHPEGIVSKNVYYHPVADSDLKSDLNGWEGKSLHMYYANPYYSADYNKKNNANTRLPQDVFTGYISQLCLTESDRVPYNTTSASSNQSGSNKKWEYVMQNNDIAPVDLNEGAVSYSPHHAKDVRISMFAQRSDGSVKPAGEITGGFVESTYDVGDLKFAG